MNKLFWVIGVMALAGAVLPAVAQSDDVADLLAAGQQVVTVGDVLMDETFDNDENWPEFDDGDSSATLTKGTYTMMAAGNFYLWQLSSDSYTDVVIQVETEQLSETAVNDYGVSCRSSAPDGLGYYFLISGDGSYAILKLSNIEDGRQELAAWDTSEAINQGNANNTITAVCAGDYLALYANGELLAEVTDDEFSEGQMGLTVGAYEDNQQTEVAFDNLVIWEATVEKGAVPGKKSDDKPPKRSTDLGDVLSAGEQALALGEVLVDEPFAVEESWPTFDDGGGFTGGVVDDVYRLKVEGNFYSWQLSEDEYDDVVIQVDATQVSDENDNNFGVTCRTNRRVGAGYYFLISGDGYYAIFKLSDPDEGRQELVGWDTSDAINQGQQTNTITAVCVGDYLALYANGELLAETRDSEFTEGYVGLTVGAYDQSAVTEVAFDNLLVQEASPE